MSFFSIMIIGVDYEIKIMIDSSNEKEFIHYEIYV